MKDSNHKDIIVTTPKAKMAEAAKEAEQIKVWGRGFYYRILSHRPQGIVPGQSRVFYVEDGCIRGFCNVANSHAQGNGKFKIFMDATSWQWIKPIPMKGFQGWRYFDRRDEVEIIGGWLDPKPSEEGE